MQTLTLLSEIVQFLSALVGLGTATALVYSAFKSMRLKRKSLEETQRQKPQRSTRDPE